jgi:apolipoprotein N-acyltransferase
MTEWWTYRPSDFLMFSARNWARLLEGAHRDLWPLQVLLVAVALAMLVAAWRRPAESARWCLAVLALTWVGVAWSFHWTRFAAINTAAPWFAAAWVAQAVLLLAWAWRATTPRRGQACTLGRPGDRPGGAGGYPLLAPLTGRPWSQAELVG